MPDYSTSIEIDAPPEVVFAHLVTPDRMVCWMGEHADLDPTPGGVFAVDVQGALIRGRFVEVEAPKRVVVTWGMEGASDLPPGSSRVEFTLTPTAAGTRLDLVHQGLPETRSETHAAGWSNYMGRLRLAAAGADPGRDRFRPAKGAVQWQP